MESVLAATSGIWVAEQNASLIRSTTMGARSHSSWRLLGTRGVKNDQVTPRAAAPMAGLTSTRRHAKAVGPRVSELRAFYTYLLRQKLVESNPVQAISAPKLPQRLPRPLKVEENHPALLEAPDATRRRDNAIGAMLELLYAGGLPRISELLALDTRRGGGSSRAQVRVLGKGAKERIVLIALRLSVPCRPTMGEWPTPVAAPCPQADARPLPQPFSARAFR